MALNGKGRRVLPFLIGAATTTLSSPFQWQPPHLISFGKEEQRAVALSQKVSLLVAPPREACKLVLLWAIYPMGAASPDLFGKSVSAL